MNKAANLSKALEHAGIEEGMKIIDKSNAEALCFDAIGDAMCLMHDDGSVNIIESSGGGVVTTEVISSANILKTLHHYRPFKEVFKGNIQ